jgi:hypothetical protein
MLQYAKKKKKPEVTWYPNNGGFARSLDDSHAGWRPCWMAAMLDVEIFFYENEHIE